MSGDAARVSVTVAVPPPLAFEIFTAEIDRWWRRGIKFRHAGKRGGFLCIEPFLGGRLFESIDGDAGPHVLEVGRVRVWQPPAHLCFTWRNANFAEHETTEVDVAFAATTSGTLVTVTHRGLSALRPEHPARHGLQGAQFSRMIGLWWGEQMTSLRELCAQRITT
ncbi:MAG TPA: SRPBCC domain-containing protein [Steroidobacteraceae bacterium]